MSETFTHSPVDETFTHFKYIVCNLCREHRLWAEHNVAEAREVREWADTHIRETGHDYWTGHDCTDYDELCRRIREGI